MIRVFASFDEFERAALKIRGVKNLRELLGLDINFVEAYPSFNLINLKDAFPETGNEKDINHIILLSKKVNLFYSARSFPKRDLGLYRPIVKKGVGESTALCLVVLREVLENYSLFFEKQREKYSVAEQVLDYEGLNDISRGMRALEDKLSDFLRILLEIEDKKVSRVDTALVNYDYDILRAKTRLMLDRTGIIMSQINASKREIELRSTNTLNKNVEFLSKMMMILTLVGVVLAVPNDLGAYFGIPAISDITPVPWIIFWVWFPSIVAALVAYVYWRKLQKEQREIHSLMRFRQPLNFLKKLSSDLRGALKKALKE